MDQNQTPPDSTANGTMNSTDVFSFDRMPPGYAGDDSVLENILDVVWAFVGIAAVIALIIVGVWVVRRYFAGRSPRALLDQRLANGEIDLATYTRLKSALEGTGVVAAAPAVSVPTSASTAVWPPSGTADSGASTNTGASAVASPETAPGPVTDTAVIDQKKDDN
ncbi:hypothetical protein [Schaalia suimastitidis]|uniref:hypothetical protein n=1 Tax=Schaalia suimastitidis TaxID=121163 RepID=UPI0004247AE7|nr:hypothetical protein [Schaalia suimastitidis]